MVCDETVVKLHRFRFRWFLNMYMVFEYVIKYLEQLFSAYVTISHSHRDIREKLLISLQCILWTIVRLTTGSLTAYGYNEIIF
jgi:hypothetical protein